MNGTFEHLAYRDGETALTALVARPQGRPRAGVLVMPTIMNRTESVLAKARALADAGYLALVADFYGQQPAHSEEARGFAGEVRRTVQSYRARAHAGLAALAGVDGVQGLPLAAIGFCMGGQAVLELARDGADLAAVVSFHGLLDTQGPAPQGGVKARILVCHGDADPLVPRGQVTGFWEEMDAAGASWHFHSYGGVKHGFTSPAPSENPAVAYDASADRQSWAAMLELFEEVLA